jgi:hypothetical protein
MNQGINGKYKLILIPASNRDEQQIRTYVYRETGRERERERERERLQNLLFNSPGMFMTTIPATQEAEMGRIAG